MKIVRLYNSVVLPNSQIYLRGDHSKSLDGSNLEINDEVVIILSKKKNMEEALHWHIDSMLEDGETIPAEFEGEWELEWNLTVKALLHYTEGLVPKSAISAVGQATRHP